MDSAEPVSNQEGGMNNENPANEDTCSLCFGPFRLPCTTSCGHLFCSDCILRNWGYDAYCKLCKCPVCARGVTEILPPVVDQPTEEETRILKDVQRYNYQNARGLFQSLKGRLLAVPSWAETRRRYREDNNPDIIHPMRRAMGLIAGVLYLLYGAAFGFVSKFKGYHLIPLVLMVNVVTIVVLKVDAARYRWKLARREMCELVVNSEPHLNDD